MCLCVGCVLSSVSCSFVCLFIPYSVSCFHTFTLSLSFCLRAFGSVQVTSFFSLPPFFFLCFFFYQGEGA